MKKEYHFEEDSQAFDETIRLDMIHDKVKKLQTQYDEDELGDANAFLDVFESEHFAPQEEIAEEATEPEEEAEEPEAFFAEEDTLVQTIPLFRTKQPKAPFVRERFAEEALEKDKEAEYEEEAEYVEEAEDTEYAEEAEEAVLPPFPKKHPKGEPQPKGQAYLRNETEAETEQPLRKRTLLLLALVALLAGFMGFALVRCTFFPTGGYEEPIAEATTPVLVQEVSASGRLLLYDITTKEAKEAFLSENTQILDEYQQAVGEATVQEGDFVLAAFAKDGTELVSLQYSNQVEQLTGSGWEVDAVNRTLTGKTESLSYGEGALFFYQGEPIAAESIASCDTLRLKRYAGTVWCVEVVEYHGFLTVENAGNIRNGSIQIGEQAAISLEEAKKVPVKAGTVSVKITGDTIETRTDTLVVESGKETIYDASRVQEKVGVIIVEPNVKDYKLYINGSASENPAVLPFGTYELVILKGGYEEWSKTVSLRQDSITVQATLEAQEPEQLPREEEPFRFGTLTITANCDDAVVYIDGERYGVAPMEVNLPYASYTVRLEKEGYAPYEQGITIGEPTATLHAQLQ